MSLEVDQGNAKELFEACDLDASGYIDRNELAAVVDLDPEDLREIFATLDKDEDGRISIEEFTENFNKFQELAALVEKESKAEVEPEQAGDRNDFEHTNHMNNRKASPRRRPKQFTFDRGKLLKAETKRKAKLLNA